MSLKFLLHLLLFISIIQSHRSFGQTEIANPKDLVTHEIGDGKLLDDRKLSGTYGKKNKRQVVLKRLDANANLIWESTFEGTGLGSYLAYQKEDPEWVFDIFPWKDKDITIHRVNYTNGNLKKVVIPFSEVETQIEGLSTEKLSGKVIQSIFATNDGVRLMVRTTAGKVAHYYLVTIASTDFSLHTYAIENTSHPISKKIPYIVNQYRISHYPHKAYVYEDIKAGETPGQDQKIDELYKVPFGELNSVSQEHFLFIQKDVFRKHVISCRFINYKGKQIKEVTLPFPLRDQKVVLGNTRASKSLHFHDFPITGFPYGDEGRVRPTGAATGTLYAFETDYYHVGQLRSNLYDYNYDFYINKYDQNGRLKHSIILDCKPDLGLKNKTKKNGFHTAGKGRYYGRIVKKDGATYFKVVPNEADFKVTPYKDRLVLTYLIKDGEAILVED